MTNLNNTADPESVGTPSSGDGSHIAPDEGSQETDLATRVAELEASNTKLTGERDSANGRVRQLRQERESSSEGFMAGVVKSIGALAQATETGNNEGLASTVSGFMSEATEASAKARAADQIARYTDQISDAVKAAGMTEEDSSLDEAFNKFSNAQTMAEKAEAVTLVQGITANKRIADAEATTKANAKTVEETREKTLKETNARSLMPSGAGSGGGSNPNDNLSNNQVIAKGLEDAGGLEAWGKTR